MRKTQNRPRLREKSGLVGWAVASHGFFKASLAIAAAAALTVTYCSSEREHETQISCLALNGWHESRGTEALGELLTGWSVINRTNDGRWGKTLCQTVWKRYKHPVTGKWVCDYSWTCKPELVAKKPSGKLWERSKRLARQLYAGWKPPKQFACVLYYRTISSKGISKISRDYFERKRYVGSLAEHRWYCENPALLKRRPS